MRYLQQPPPAVLRRKICVVGPSFEFMGGLSVYTCRLANSLADSHDVSLLLLDKLIPARLYPGGARAGRPLTNLSYRPEIQRLGNIDWYWGRNLGRAISALRRARPDVLILQWWTAATLHTYLALATAARRLDIPVVLEFHEIQDPGEAAMPGAARYADRFMPMLLARTSGALIHNKHDMELLRATFGGSTMDRLAVQVAPHGPYDHLTGPSSAELPSVGQADPSRRPTNLLCFGLIRPYKGVEDVVAAFNAMTPTQVADFTLTVVGETWENWTAPAELIAASPYRDRITFINRYVSDDEAAGYFAQADVLVLGYRRGSASGPLQIAMSAGRQVVLYAVGGLVEAVRDYAGAQLVRPSDVPALQQAILNTHARQGERFTDPHSWDATTAAHGLLANALVLA